MASSNGNVFRVTGPLCGEFASQRPVTQSFDVFFYLRLNKREAADLKRHRIHYDVTVMHCQGPFSISDKGSYLKILWSLEVARMVISIVLSIWFLTSASAALLSKHQNYRGIGQYRIKMAALLVNIIYLTMTKFPFRCNIMICNETDEYLSVGGVKNKRSISLDNCCTHIIYILLWFQNASAIKAYGIPSIYL